MSYIVTALSGNSQNLVQLSRVLSSRPIYSLFRNSTKILASNSHFNGIFGTKGEVQQKRSYSTDKPTIDDDSSEKILNTNTDTKFSLRVAKHALQKGLATNNQKNMMCSPMSMDALLSIIAVGAEGELQTQFRKLLGYDNIDDLKAVAARLAGVVKKSEGTDAPKINFANVLWLDKKFSLKKSFQSSIQDLHNVEVKQSDFTQAGQVVDTVNSWAKARTKGLIKQVLKPSSIDDDTMMLLANALYFKGIWVQQFDRKKTRKDDFYLLNGANVRASFMNKYDKYFEHGKHKEYQVLRLPYKQGTLATAGEKQRIFSMYIFLPHKKNGLANLMKKINIDTIKFWHNLKLSSKKFYSVSIPKFKFECNVSLSEHMKELGLTLPFDKERKDLFGMVDNLDKIQGWLYVKDIFQQCRIEANEAGTEAACFTGCLMGYETCAPSVTFVADHPFMFVIREDVSGEILFTGTMLNPTN